MVKGKRWLFLSRWVNLTASKRQDEGAMLNYLQRWIDQLRWQRLEPFQKLAAMLLDHLEGILNYCRTKAPLGVAEAINGNIKARMRRGRGYRNLRRLLLEAQRMATLNSSSTPYKRKLSISKELQL